jgi:hypothetical protein
MNVARIMSDAAVTQLKLDASLLTVDFREV